MSARRAWLSGVAVAAVLVASAGAFAATAPRGQAVEGYRAYLDPEGGLIVLTADPASPGGPITASEARSGLGRALAGIPSTSAAGAVAELLDGSADPEVMRVLSSGARADGSVVSSYAAYVLAPEGLQLLAERVGGTDLWYDPPMTVLPEPAVPGTAWSEEGAVSGVATYTMEGTVEPGTQPGCIRTITRSVIALDGEEVRSLGQETEWCPGRGSVSAVDLDNGLRAEVADPPLAAGPLPSVPAPAALASPGDLPLFATTIRLLPHVAGGGVVLANSTNGDVLLAQPPIVEGVVPVAWLQHPGGEILGMAADEGGPVVTTTRREAVALDRAGRWRWTAALPEAAAGDPVLIDGVVVVALLNGSVVGLDRETGQEAWTARMVDAVRVGPVASGRHAVVADIAGGISAFAADGQRAWDAGTGPVLAPLTATPDGAVAVSDRDGLLTLVGADGRSRWSVPLADSALGHGAVAGSVLVLPTGSGPQAIRLEDGSSAWSLPDLTEAAVWPVPGSEDVLVTSTGSARLVTAQGITRAEVSVTEPDGSTAEGIQVVWLAGRPAAVTADGAFVPIDSVMGTP